MGDSAKNEQNQTAQLSFRKEDFLRRINREAGNDINVKLKQNGANNFNGGIDMTESMYIEFPAIKRRFPENVLFCFR